MSSAKPLPDEPLSYCRRFSLAEILSFTRDFSDDLVVGEGGFGKVYRGFIENGATTVAIKRLNAESKQGAREFWTEIKTLSKLWHTHLVTLIGFSDDENEMILVYEYVPNGTIAEHLYGRSRGEDGDRNHLTWEQRLNICIGAACGLDCLHENNIIHRDVKSTNILLNEYWVAKIADFGLSKMTHMQSHVSTDVKGTFGYLDPEYFFSHRLTVKSDVYAFGVVLLEVLFARPPVDTSFEELERRSLPFWAQKCFKKGRLLDMIDSSLRDQVSPKGLKMFSKIAINCLQKDSKGRPTMADVLRSLKLVSASENARLHKGKVVASLYNYGFRHFNFEEVKAATNNFNEDQIIGRGKFSIVYRGHIDWGTREVAIKTWTRSRSDQQMYKIKMEMEVQHYLHHLNLVSLIGYYIYDHNAILVYDYMANRSLHYHLYNTKSSALSWDKRIDICLSIARALQYLRSKWPFVFRCLKLTNIHLDRNWNVKISNWHAKISDFQYPKLTYNGSLCQLWILSKRKELTHNEAKEHKSASNFGLQQYTDPEFYVTRSFSKKCDVYSFGVILMELLCGRSGMIYLRAAGTTQVNLVEWFKKSAELNLECLYIDPYVSQPIAPVCVRTYVGIALGCLSNESVNRPTMEVVISTLQRASQLQKTWQEKYHINKLPDESKDSYKVRMEVLKNRYNKIWLQNEFQILNYGLAYTSTEN